MALWQSFKRQDQRHGLDTTLETYAEFDKVSLSLGGKAVLRDVSLSLSERRIGVIGLNGSGKSSLVRLVNGLRRPDQGTVCVFGSRIEDIVRDLPRHVGFVFQNPDHQAIFPTVEEEVAFGLTQLGVSKQESRSGALSFLAQHGCAPLAKKPFAELSEGQKQLICILSVLVMKPEILILDEPLASLDGLASRKILAKLMALDQKLLMISHDLACLGEFDRILWLDQGQIRMDGVPGDVLPAFVADLDRQAVLDRAGAAL